MISIYRSSFLVGKTRYFSLFDDEMISMRYAKNLAHGSGLIWNPGGQLVQGFTNLSWTLYMGLIHLLPIPLSKTSLIVQLTGLVFMIVSLFYVKKIAELISGNSKFVTVLSVLFSAFYYPLINWTVILGTEVSILTLILTMSVYETIKCIKTGKFSLVPFIFLGLGITVRLDFLLPSLALIFCSSMLDRKNRNKYLLNGGVILFFFILSVLLFQLFYYHSLLPNTYFLKLTGFPLFYRITKGIFVTLKSINILIFVVPFIYLYFSKNKYISILLTVYATVFIYSIYVGGDIWEIFGGANRFVAFAMPLFFISFFMSLQWLRTYVEKYGKRFYKKYRVTEGFVILMIFILINTGSDNMLSQLLLIDKPFYKTLVSQKQVVLAQKLTSATTGSAKIAIVVAGTVPYFTDREFVDILGVNEKTIAHEPANIRSMSAELSGKLIDFVPGHMKWDYPYIIKKYNPDLIIADENYGPNQEEKKTLLNKYTIVKTPENDVFYVRENDPNVFMTDLKTL